MIQAIKFPLGWRHIQQLVQGKNIKRYQLKVRIAGCMSEEATGGFPSQMTSNTKIFTMSWRHLFIFLQCLFRMSRLILLMLMLWLVSLHAAKMGTAQLAEVHHDFLQCIHDTRTYTYANIYGSGHETGCLVTWFCYQLIAKPGNRTATFSYIHVNFR